MSRVSFGIAEHFARGQPTRVPSAIELTEIGVQRIVASGWAD
jgi:hypothetical protein